MGKTSAAVKNQWNKEHYRQIKVCVPPEIAASFKAVCITDNVSMSCDLVNFMRERIGLASKTRIEKDLLGTKAGRRRMLLSIIKQIEQVKDAEEQYRDNIPGNLQNSIRYEDAEECISSTEEALDALYRLF